MATHAITQKVELQKSQVVGGARFDWTMIAVCTWLMVGAYSDVWAHNHLKIDNFFTPWHGLLYTGFLATAIFLTGTFIKNRLQGYSLRHAIPVGYEISLLGVMLFLCSGIGDMIWHTLFGIELTIDAALSPTHIGLAISGTMILSGPFRAAWHRQNNRSGLDLVGSLPMLISLAFVLAMINVLLGFAQPLSLLWPTLAQQSLNLQGLAIVGILFQTMILMAWVLLTIRRWKTPFGFFTLLFTLLMAFLSVPKGDYFMILVTALAGLVTDILVWRLQPSLKRLEALRLFAFLVPVVLYLLYFLSLFITANVHWTIHMWLGSVFAAGLVGFSLSYLLVPPQVPVEAEQ